MASQANWEMYLGSNPRVPYDVYFTFPDEDTSDRIGAHRFLLAAVSDSFHAMFNGPLPETGDVAVKDASSVAFTALRDLIYNKTPDWSKFGKFELYLQVYKLADKYLIESLKKDIFQACRKFTITEDNFQEVTVCADNYSCFEDLSEMILGNCAVFLYWNFGTFEKIVEFIKKYELHYGGNTGILMKIMSMIFLNISSEVSSKDCVEMQDCYSSNMCTYMVTWRNKYDWGFYQCKDCADGDGKFIICKPCADTCHQGHEVIGPNLEHHFFCDCGGGEMEMVFKLC